MELQITLLKVIRIVGERLHRRALGVDLGLQRQHVAEYRATIGLTEIAERIRKGCMRQVWQLWQLR